MRHTGQGVTEQVVFDVTPKMREKIARAQKGMESKCEIVKFYSFSNGTYVCVVKGK